MSAILRTDARRGLAPADSPSLPGEEAVDAPRSQILLITCSDRCREDRILDGLDPDAILIIRTSADPGAGAILDRRTAIESAVLGGGIGEILVCGHSRCPSIRARVREEGDAHASPIAREAAVSGGLGRLLRGVAESKAMLARAEEQVRGQFEALMALPVISEAVARGELTVQGRVYLDESGSILAYDPGRRRFEPLADAMAPASM